MSLDPGVQKALLRDFSLFLSFCDPPLFSSSFPSNTHQLNPPTHPPRYKRDRPMSEIESKTNLNEKPKKDGKKKGIFARARSLTSMSRTDKEKSKGKESESLSDMPPIKENPDDSKSSSLPADSDMSPDTAIGAPPKKSQSFDVLVPSSEEVHSDEEMKKEKPKKKRSSSTKESTDGSSSGSKIRSPKKDRKKGEKKGKGKKDKGKEKDTSSELLPVKKEPREDEERQIARKIPSLSRLKHAKINSPREGGEEDKPPTPIIVEPVRPMPKRTKIHSTKSANIQPQRSGADTSRVVQSVALPIDKALSLNMAVDEDKVRIPLVQSYLRREGKLSVDAVMKILQLALEAFRAEPNVVTIDAPCCVFGDLHGQFYDLMNLLDLSGTPPHTQCLFLGDYVDRGMFGIETILYLLSFKINYPNMFWLLRGNHESRQITDNFNFHRECQVKYTEEVYDLCMQVFDSMPLAAVVRADFGNFFCVHGGIGPDVTKLRDIKKIDRFQETPFKGPVASLLWSDPISPEEYPDMTQEDLETFFFRPNEGRGCVGWLFGHRATNTFLSKNNFITLIRGHEVQQFGIAEHYFGVGNSDFPKCITLFSAPNYCEIYNNKAAYLKLLKDSMDYEVVDAVPHPYVLPDFMNGISFSLSFVVEIIAALLLRTTHKLFLSGADEDDDLGEEEEAKLDEMVRNTKESVEAMKKKREERLQLLNTNIKALASPSDNELSTFELAVKYDRNVERMKTSKSSLRRIKSNPF